jgi:hypothetical protein
MIHPSHSPDIEPVYQLLDGYSFDVDGYSADVVIAGWLEQYGPVWVSHAITEALYQGRYKIISIEHILKLWQRRGQPIRHFNREFESIILGQTLLCPTGYGDGIETQASAKAKLPVVAEAEQSTPLSPAEMATPEPRVDGPDMEDNTAIAPAEQSVTAAPQANPFDAAAIAPSPDSVPAFHSGVIPNFRPLVADLESAWPQAEEIRPFVPRQDSSDLHQRLRAVVKGGMRE